MWYFWITPVSASILIIASSQTGFRPACIQVLTLSVPQPIHLSYVHKKDLNGVQVAGPNKFLYNAKISNETLSPIRISPISVFQMQRLQTTVIFRYRITNDKNMIILFLLKIQLHPKLQR